jgi:isocitrate dehydrogenase
MNYSCKGDGIGPEIMDTLKILKKLQEPPETADEIEVRKVYLSGNTAGIIAPESWDIIRKKIKYF